jgi:hypothetical protein
MNLQLNPAGLDQQIVLSTKKTKFLAGDLKTWRRRKPKLDDQLQAIEDTILQEQHKPPSEQDFDLQQQLSQQHQDLLIKDEQFHLQRAKKNWARLGDTNTSYFHQAIVKRTRKNMITYLINPDATEATTQDQIATTLTNYFQNIFTTDQTYSNNTPNLLLSAGASNISNTSMQQPAQLQQNQEYTSLQQ